MNYPKIVDCYRCLLGSIRATRKMNVETCPRCQEHFYNFSLFQLQVAHRNAICIKIAFSIIFLSYALLEFGTAQRKLRKFFSFLVFLEFDTAQLIPRLEFTTLKTSGPDAI
jgi:hypothetical protein